MAKGAINTPHHNWAGQLNFLLNHDLTCRAACTCSLLSRRLLNTLLPDFLVTPDRRYLSIAVDCDIVAPDDAERVRFLRSAHASLHLLKLVKGMKAR